MAILANRGALRNNIRDYGIFSVYLVRRVFVVLLLSFSLLMLKFSPPILLQRFVLEIGGRIVQTTEYIYQSTVDSIFLIYDQVVYFKNLEMENMRLKLENDSLRKISEQNNVLTIENQSLKKALNLTIEDKNKGLVAKVIGISSTPYTKRAIISSGIKDGVKVDDVVKGTSGLLGKVIEASGNYSKIMLVGDNDFHIPVISALNNSYGILVRQDNSFKIIYLEENHDFTVGETIYTSGDGKIFPSGIAVGVVIKVEDNEVYVKPIEKINSMGFVHISQSYTRNLK
ncbi:MAG TPA: rod shape-determining protein MreC [Candidatus Megaira endosymbiont of Nemacystus decipiens]|nr:rod shape-determining protein MreC [Candidatus Megaera endosymbiont of Nemacystus decipiens]